VPSFPGCTERAIICTLTWTSTSAATDLSAQRPELVLHAVSSASTKHGTTFAPESVVVLGDSPHDVDAALHHSGIAIGVATGQHSEQELHDAGAHVVLTDLSDTAAVLAAVLGRQ
jgi:phosphoglycolate phosphatase